MSYTQVIELIDAIRVQLSNCEELGEDYILQLRNTLRELLVLKKYL